jgi:thiosulfate/3-mercaptopyruvate sulfurtransferase
MPDLSPYAKDGIISAKNLGALIQSGQPHLKILDATYALPGSNVSPYQAYVMQHIDGAQFFDIDDIADHTNLLPHMIPPAAQFEAQMNALGISSNDLVVIYDQSGLYMAAARAWWMMRVFGHDNVCVLDGGVQAWQGLGLPLVSGEEIVKAPGSFTAHFRPELVSDKDGILNTLDDNNTLILDARPAERFAGMAGEPRGGMRSGHIPGSQNLPFGLLIDPKERTLQDTPLLEKLFDKTTGAKRIITSCGSGVTACVLALGLYRTGRTDISVYDGSWSEWGATESCTPIANLHS